MLKHLFKNLIINPADSTTKQLLAGQTIYGSKVSQVKRLRASLLDLIPRQKGL